MKKIWVLYFVVGFSALLKSQFNYGHQMEFGKNRIQYKGLVWQYLDYDKYRIYYYQGGVELAKYTAINVGKQIASLEKRLDYAVEDKINILVYNSQHDFKQSNLGFSADEISNGGGVTRIVGDKLSLYFDGSHAGFDQQLRAGLAELILDKILYGGNIAEVLRNSNLLTLPDWYMNGLIKYLSEGWSTYNDNLMYDALMNNTFGTFNYGSGREANETGHAMWYYIISTYGESVIPNVLYMTKLTRSIDHAFITTLGVTLDNLIYDFNESFQRRVFMYRDTARKTPNVKESIMKRYKSSKHYYQAKVNDEGNKIIYATNESNQLKVYLKDLDTKKETRVLKLNPKMEQLVDYNYPLLAWHPNGKNYAMLFPKKDELVLEINSLEKEEPVVRNLQGFEKINSFAYNHDGKKIVLSAIKKGRGQSDIFVMTINTGALEQLTNDSWDDLNPVFTKKSSQIAFESNRKFDTLRAEDDANYQLKMKRNMDIFVAPYPFKSKVLLRITNTPESNERIPQSYQSNFITYLSDKNGIYNMHIAEFDSAITFVDTTEHYSYFFKTHPISNSDRNILDYQINNNGTYIVKQFFYKGKDMLIVSALEPLNHISIAEPGNTWYRGYISPAILDPSEFKEIKNNEILITPQTTEIKPKGIDFENYKFGDESDKSPETNVTKGQTKKDTIKKIALRSFKFPMQKNYFTSFYTDYVVNQFDHSFMANTYQVFSQSGSPIYLNPPLNITNKIAISDLFEDQRILGGYRLSLNTNEVFLSWEQRKERLDKQIVYDRLANHNVVISNENGSSYEAKVVTHSLRYSLKYPISTAASVKATALYRNDIQTTVSYGDITLRKKASYNNQIGMRFEYVFDNSRKIMTNIMNGSRMKVWTEFWQSTDKNQSNLFTSGFDLRNYKKVHREVTWCNRFAGGNSMGSKKLLFYLGGVDNAFFPQFNNGINIVNPSQYGFQTLATNLRGWKQNSRNGNNFLVYNSELRIPVVKYVLNYPVKSELLNNLQVIGFFDAGIAWTGLNPLSAENTENSREFLQVDPATGKGSTSIRVSVINYRNPLIGSTGFGLRTKAFGYFMRLDFGWGIDAWQFANKAVANFSIGTDF